MSADKSGGQRAAPRDRSDPAKLCGLVSWGTEMVGNFGSYRTVLCQKHEISPSLDMSPSETTRMNNN